MYYNTSLLDTYYNFSLGCCCRISNSASLPTHVQTRTLICVIPISVNGTNSFLYQNMEVHETSPFHNDAAPPLFLVVNTSCTHPKWGHVNAKVLMTPLPFHRSVSYVGDPVTYSLIFKERWLEASCHMWVILNIRNYGGVHMLVQSKCQQNWGITINVQNNMNSHLLQYLIRSRTFH